MRRLVRVTAAFLITLVAYWAYALVAVPLIEPSARRPTDEIDRKPVPVPDRLQELRCLFPADAWELQNHNVVRSEQFLLLFREYKNRPDGSIDFHPCTVVVPASDPELSDAERMRRAIVLQVPEGAELRFDKPFQIGRPEPVKIVSGTLAGQVLIRSQGKSPEPDDDLLIVTRDVQMTEKQGWQIWTPHGVDFRWGGNYGRGRQMRIKLLPGDSGANRSVSVGGMELFELAQVDRLHLLVPQARGTGEAAPSGAAEPAAEAKPKAPLEVTCRGPFRCNMLQQVATFEDRVHVVRLNPVGPPDQLNCELLSLYLRPRKPPGKTAPSGKPAAEPKRGTSFELEIERVEARGDPVVVIAPSERLNARGQRLEHDLIKETLALDGVEEVMLQQGPNEIHAYGIRYQSAGKDKLGQVDAGGPGWVRGEMADRPGQLFEARWRERLLVRPDKDEQLLSLLGAASARMDAFGSIGGQEIHLWLEELPADQRTTLDAKTGEPVKRQRLRPTRLLARDGVQIVSPQLSANVVQMEMWFEPAGAAGAAPAGGRWKAGAMHSRGYLQPVRLSAADGGLGGHRDGTGMVWLYPVQQRVDASTAAPPSPWPAATYPRARRPAPAVVYPSATKPRATNTATPAGYVDATTGTPPLANASVPGPWQGSDAAPGTPPAVPPGFIVPGLGPAPLVANKPQQHFDIRGRLLRARALLREGGTSELVEVMVEEGVRLTETQTAAPDQRPVTVTGDQLHVVDAMQPHAAVTVLGRPARFEGRGLTLIGSNINLNRGTNRLWITGVGRMDLPMQQDLQGKPLTDGRLTVEWRRAMDFDGRLARFEESVVASTAQQVVRTDTLEVLLERTIRFTENSPQQQQPQAEQISCQGNVVIENRETDEQGPLAFEHIEVVDLRANLINGALTAGGPGFLHSVRRGSAQSALGGKHDAAAGPGVGPGAAGAILNTGGPLGLPSAGGDRSSASGTAAAANPLQSLHVRFQGSVSGNLHKHTITFNDQVHTAYAPVERFDAPMLPLDQPEALGPNGMVLTCDHMTVLQTIAPMTRQRSAELEAVGNTTAEGTEFTARALRMTYAEQKDLLILEGDGRSDAELFRQQFAGGERSRVAAKKILYWPKSRKVQIDGARALEFTDFGSPKGNKGK